MGAWITVRGLYELMLGRMGRTRWWPADSRFEIAIGAILTQNTVWGNVEVALRQLKERHALEPQALLDMPDEELGELIRPAGYWRTKAGYVKAFCTWFSSIGELRDDELIPNMVRDRTDAELRDELLAVRGIGGETADDILLYVFDRPAFIADRYARRLFETLGIADLPKSYEGFRSRVQPFVADWGIGELKEFHGLIDELGKTCRNEHGWNESFIAGYALTFENLKHVEHGFPPVFDDESRVLVLGSMPSPKSREMGFYYGHPRNRFWPVMAAVFDDDSCLADGVDAERLVEARKRFALRHHVALWDVIASCDIVGASDASIRNAEPNDLAALIRASHITHVFTTGAKAAQLYRKLCEPRLVDAGITDLPMTQLPSTSPANAAAKLSRLVDEYSCIAESSR